MKMKKMHRSWLLLTALLAIILVLAGCGVETPGGETTTPPTEATEPAEPIAMEQRSLLLASGEEAKLTVTGGNGIAYESSDPEVASVDASGTIKALKKGNAMITVSSGSQTLCCGVIVDGEGKMLDVSGMAANVVFADVQLYHPMEIIDFAVDSTENAFYFSQQYATSAYGNLKSDSMLTKVEQINGVWQRAEYVHLFNHGYGYFDLERDGKDVYLLTESNGPMTNRGTTISRAVWENKKLYDEEFGQTCDLPEISDRTSFHPKSDAANDMIAVYVESGRKSYYAIYDRDALLSGEQNSYLLKVVCEAGQEPENGVDDSQGLYNATVRSFALHDGYIYQLSGGSKMYLSVFDLEGNLQYCHKIEDNADVVGRTPSSLAFGEDGSLYLAVTSGNSGDLYLANVWKFEEVIEK